MSKLHKILLGVFCGGILLCGLGTGIAFTEFSALAYGGTHILGETEIVTKDIDVEFEPGEEPCWIGGYYNGRNQDKAELDESVPENTVRFRVTYNQARVEPWAEYDKQENSIACCWYWHDGGNDIELLMEAKDLALQDLKEGKISSFDTVGVESITVLVNPANEGDVVFHF